MTGLRPFLPILFVFLKGLDYSYLQIGTLFSVMATTSLIFEIPAGSFADKYGSKYCLILSSIMLGTAFFLVGSIERYDFMIATFALWGASKSFYSGADTTLIIESLKESGELKKTSKYLSKKWACFYYGLAVGGLLCPIFINFDSAYAFYFSAILYALSIPVLITIKQPPLDKGAHAEIHHIKSTKDYFVFIRNGVNYLLRHKTVKYLLLFSVMFSTCSMIFFQYLQIMLQEAGVEKINFGFFYAFFTLTAAIASQKAHKLDDLLGEKRCIYLLLALSLISLFGIKFFIFFPLALIPIMAMQLQAGTFIPIMSNYLNHHIESHHRATLNSIKSFVGGLLMAICSPIVGLLSDLYDFRTALFSLACFLVLIAIGPALKISDRVRRRST
jgi:MFS family permease